MCEFCGECRKNKTGFNGEEMYLNEFDVLCFDNSGHEYVRGWIEINYCPMCGRKLVDE